MFSESEGQIHSSLPCYSKSFNGMCKNGSYMDNKFQQLTEIYTYYTRYITAYKFMQVLFIVLDYEFRLDHMILIMYQSSVNVN